MKKRGRRIQPTKRAYLLNKALGDFRLKYSKMTPVKFRNIRRALGITPEELAGLLDLTIHTIHNKETGVTAITRCDICALLWVKQHMFDLLQGVGNNEKTERSET